MSKKNSAIPVGDRVLVIPDQAQQEMFGLMIPSQAQKKVQTGRVIAVGKGKGELEMQTKAGDTILYSDFAGTEIKIDDVVHIIMRETDVYCILKNEEV